MLLRPRTGILWPFSAPKNPCSSLATYVTSAVPSQLGCPPLVALLLRKEKRNIQKDLVRHPKCRPCCLEWRRRRGNGQQETKGRSKKQKSSPEITFGRPFLAVVILSFAKNTGGRQITTIVFGALKIFINCVEITMQCLHILGDKLIG